MWSNSVAKQKDVQKNKQKNPFEMLKCSLREVRSGLEGFHNQTHQVKNCTRINHAHFKLTNHTIVLGHGTRTKVRPGWCGENSQRELPNQGCENKIKSFCSRGVCSSLYREENPPCFHHFIHEPPSHMPVTKLLLSQARVQPSSYTPSVRPSVRPSALTHPPFSPRDKTSEVRPAPVTQQLWAVSSARAWTIEEHTVQPRQASHTNTTAAKAWLLLWPLVPDRSQHAGR